MATVLYTAPYTCGRVAAIALEDAGVEFEARLVRFVKGEHKSPEFKRVNPKGKVPALDIGGQVLTENVAILSYLSEWCPQVGLLPLSSTAAYRARKVAS